ncbi:MAG TPA: hypothetical protein VMV68_08610 [Spirochaetia bacterium]|nr:hypothetical protein [Spirochaetia bacterium]
MSYQFEVIRMDLYDVGRSVDLEKAQRLVPASRGFHVVAGRDTPESIYVPKPLIVQLDSMIFDQGTTPASAGQSVRSISIQAKIYEDGVVSMIGRMVVSAELTELHTLRSIPLPVERESTTIGELMSTSFKGLLVKISQAITVEEYSFDSLERESYTVYCLTDPVPDPRRFLDDNAHYLTTFLLGERPDFELHDAQIESTIRHLFSFRKSDVIVLDLDRCFIIDPARDYEDILLVLELANYQLLELRTLDKVLDRWLDQAEDDIRAVYMRRSRRMRKLSKKLGGLLPLRLDALFILENLENTSKIIGDYYLGQIYTHLCDLINTKAWELSVHRRLDTLQEIYSMAKIDVNERVVLMLEVLVVVFFAAELVALLLPIFLPK